MSASRLMQQSLRRVAVQQSGVFSRTALMKMSSPASIALSQYKIQSRSAATTSMPVSEGNAILASQRLNRPTSPHLSIYKPQITWIPSILNRITGSILSGGFYLFGVLYLASPLLGIHMESGAMVAAFGALPFIAKASLKFLIALPFTFHSFNGIRHLIWDTGRELTNKAVNMTGWLVVGVTFVSSGFLAFFY